MVEGSLCWREGELETDGDAVCPSVTISALRRLEEEGHKFEAILSYMRPVLKGLNKVT